MGQRAWRRGHGAGRKGQSARQLIADRQERKAKGKRWGSRNFVVDRGSNILEFIEKLFSSQVDLPEYLAQKWTSEISSRMMRYSCGSSIRMAIKDVIII